MRSLLSLAFAVTLFAAGIVSESHSSDLMRFDGEGWFAWQIAEDEELQIYVRIESGSPREIRVPRWDCGRHELPAAENLGIVDAAESVSWLSRFIEPRSDISNEFMAAISAHPGSIGTRVLQNVVMSSRDRKSREEAIFWLAQSDDEAAFAFLDALLTKAY